MKQHTSARRIEEELTRGPVPEPPAGLLENIQREIPEELGSSNSSSRGVVRPAWWLAAAASLFVAFAGSWLAYRVRQQGPTLDQGAVEETASGREAAPSSTSPPPTAAEEREAVAQEQPVGSEPQPSDELGSAVADARRVELPTPAAAEAPATPLLESVAALRRTERSRVEVDSRAAAALPARPDRLRRTELSVEQPAELVMPVESESRPMAPAPGKVVGALPGGGVPGGVLGGVLGGVPLERQGAAPMGRYRPLIAAPPSTGGTAEPNDQPYGDMFFGSYGVNPFIDTEDDPLSTFGLDVDTGSYTLVRGYLERGHLPPPEAVRVEEFVNAFDYGDRPPRRGDFALTLAGAPTPYAENDRYVLLRLGLVAREVARRERPPAVLIFTVDVSGSMAQGNRLEMVKDSLALLLDQLEPEDEVGLVVYDDRARVLLEPTGDRWALERAIARLVPGGSTNAEAGLVLAYDLASRHLSRGALHRVILCSDGVANVGRTGPESILERIGREAARGIELTTVGFGMGNYNDHLMEQLADQGDGRYAYVDTLEEARRIFVEELAGTLQTVARDAKVQVEFDPRTVERYRLLGYENRDVADRDFRNDRVDAGEIGAGHGVTALYEVKLAEEAAGEHVATLRLRYRSAETDRVVEVSEELAVADLAGSWERAPVSLRLAATVAELAELLKGSYWAKGGDLDRVLREARRLERETGSEETAELVARAEEALALRDGSPEPDPLERR